MPYAARMTAAGQFIAEPHQERRRGKVTSETELHLKHVFRKLGWDTAASTLAAAVGEEIDRLEREVATLRRLRAEVLGGRSNSGIPSFDKPGLLKQSVDCLIIIIADVESAFTTDLEAAGNGARRVLRQIDDHRKTRHRVDACSVECTAGMFDNAVANWYVWICGYGVEALPSVSGV